MAKKKGGKKKAASKRGTSGARGKTPTIANVSGLHLVEVTIIDGTIMQPDPLPVIYAFRGDVVIWLIVNQSGSTIKAGLVDFKKKSTGQSLDAITWFNDTDTVSIKAGLTGVLGGTVTLFQQARTVIKYNVALVKGTKHTTYDPDLEVSPPGPDRAPE